MGSPGHVLQSTTCSFTTTIMPQVRFWHRIQVASLFPPPSLVLILPVLCRPARLLSLHSIRARELADAQLSHGSLRVGFAAKHLLFTYRFSAFACCIDSARWRTKPGTLLLQRAFLDGQSSGSRCRLRRPS